METPFSNYKSIGIFLDLKAANSVVSGPIWPKFELVRDFMHVLVTCKYKNDRIKTNREMVETSFSPLWVNGGFLLPWKPEFWSNLPQHLMQFFPTPVTLHIKFDQDWPTGFRDIKVQTCKIFDTQWQVTTKSGLTRPKIEVDRAFMPVLVTSNFDDDSIKNERASMETPFSHYKSMRNFLDAQGQLTP